MEDLSEGIDVLPSETFRNANPLRPGETGPQTQERQVAQGLEESGGRRMGRWQR